MPEDRIRIDGTEILLWRVQGHHPWHPEGV
jgi:hypothetical protein